MVSILIVLDDALVPDNHGAGWVIAIVVSILIVLDDALVLKMEMRTKQNNIMSQSLLCWTML